MLVAVPFEMKLSNCVAIIAWAAVGISRPAQAADNHHEKRWYTKSTTLNTVDASHHLDAFLDHSHLFKVNKFDHFDPNFRDGGDHHNNHKHNHRM